MLKKNEIYIDNNVNANAVLDFINRCKDKKNDIHSIVVYQNGRLRLRAALPPYSCEYKAQIYSLSKSFTATAIGFLVDDGKLSLDDKIIDIFADKAPESPNENLKALKLRHLLSMNTGHAACVLEKIKNSNDVVKAFMEEQQEYVPGTHFAYNNAATYMLSEIVSRYTEMTMLDFLNLRLFKPLGITNVHWDTYKTGKQQGAVGLHASVDDIAKLGLLYLNGGIWDGKRLLSKEWVENATAFQSDTSNNGKKEWTAGYGFQIWRNSIEGFRGDGAFGQISVALPSKDMVIAVLAHCEDICDEIDEVYQLAENFENNEGYSQEEFCQKINEFNQPKETDKFSACSKTDIYICSKNDWGIKLVQFETADRELFINFSDGEKWQKIVCGRGKYCETNIRIKHFKPTLLALAGTDEKIDVRFAAYYFYKNNRLTVYMRYLDNPHTDSIVFDFNNNQLKISQPEVNSLLPVLEKNITAALYNL